MAAPFQVTNPYHSQGLAAGGSALLDAVNKGKIHLAKFILAAGEDDVVNTRDFKGKTPLIRACYIKEEKTRAQIVHLLLAHRAKVNQQDDVGRTVLSYACEMRCNDMVLILVQNNIDPDIPDYNGNTALIYSSMVGNDTAVGILVKSFRRLGLNVDHLNADGYSALLIATKLGFVECASHLALEGRACVSYRDKEKGLNAAEWARCHGWSPKQILPLSAGASPLQQQPYPSPDRNGHPDRTKHPHARRSFSVQKKSVDAHIISDFARMKVTGLNRIQGSTHAEKVLVKRGSLPSISLSSRSTPEQRSIRGSPSIRSRSGSLGTTSLMSDDGSAGLRSANKPDLLSNIQKTKGTQTDIIQMRLHNTNPRRPKSAEPCSTRYQYGSTLDAVSTERRLSSCARHTLCAACRAIITSPHSDGMTSITTDGSTGKIDVSIYSEDEMSDVFRYDGPAGEGCSFSFNDDLTKGSM